MRAAFIRLKGGMVLEAWILVYGWSYCSEIL